MINFNGRRLVTVLVALGAAFCISAPTLAQFIGIPVISPAKVRTVSVMSGAPSEANQKTASINQDRSKINFQPSVSVPTLAGAACGSIGPQSGDVIVFRDVSTSGVVRLNPLAKFEVFLNIFSCASVMMGILAGGGLVASSLQSAGSPWHRVLMGMSIAIFGTSLPFITRALIIAAYDASVFA